MERIRGKTALPSPQLPDKGAAILHVFPSVDVFTTDQSFYFVSESQAFLPPFKKINPVLSSPLLYLFSPSFHSISKHASILSYVKQLYKSSFSGQLTSAFLPSGLWRFLYYLSAISSMLLWLCLHGMYTKVSMLPTAVVTFLVPYDLISYQLFYPLKLLSMIQSLWERSSPGLDTESAES